MKEVQTLLKMISDGLKTLAQGVDAIAEKVDETAKTKSGGKAANKKQSAPAKTAKPVRKKAAPVKKATPQVDRKKAAEPTTAIDTVLNIISRSPQGVNTAAIKGETGYDQKKISNIIYKLNKQGKIKAIQKGVYVKA
jgi:predicted Rossmann fold nucleotide-binding protein DprA/Smf involved in DNA uptake